MKKNLNVDNETNVARGQRVKSVRLKHKLTQEEFGKIFGMSKIWTHSTESGRTELNLKAIRTLHQKFGVRYEYIIDGIGIDSHAEEVERLSKELEKLKEELVKEKREKQAFLDYIDDLKKKKARA
jgi:transcriptional regulator with XRE-family HTH domain